MKKIFLFVFIFLAACSGQVPQVTVTSKVTVTLPPTATIIPIPTLHPQFVILQEKIAASGERFYLAPDGSINDGATPVKGIKVGAEGKITITVDGEPVEIDPSSMNFDDENGLSIEGFEDTDGDGNWEAAKLTPEQQLAVDLERWNLTSDKYNVDYDQEGKIELREKGTNRLVYWNGRWSSEVIVDMVIATNDCQATEFVPASSTANWSVNISIKDFKEYISSIFRSIDATPFWKLGQPNYLPVPFRNDTNCWGLKVGILNEDPTHFVWPKADGEVEAVGIFEPQ